MKNWMKYGSIGVCFWSLLLVLVGVSQLTFGAYYISKLPIFKIGSPVWIGFLNVLCAAGLFGLHHKMLGLRDSPWRISDSQPEQNKRKIKGTSNSSIHQSIGDLSAPTVQPFRLYWSVCLCVVIIFINVGNAIICQVGEWKLWMSPSERDQLRTNLSVLAVQAHRVTAAQMSLAIIIGVVCTALNFWLMYKQRKTCQDPALETGHSLPSSNNRTVTIDHAASAGSTASMAGSTLHRPRKVSVRGVSPAGFDNPNWVYGENGSSSSSGSQGVLLHPEPENSSSSRPRPVSVSVISDGGGGGGGGGGSSTTRYATIRRAPSILMALPPELHHNHFSHQAPSRPIHLKSASFRFGGERDPTVLRQSRAAAKVTRSKTMRETTFMTSSPCHNGGGKHPMFETTTQHTFAQRFQSSLDGNSALSFVHDMGEFDEDEGNGGISVASTAPVADSPFAVDPPPPKIPVRSTKVENGMQTTVEADVMQQEEEDDEEEEERPPARVPAVRHQVRSSDRIILRVESFRTLQSSPARTSTPPAPGVQRPHPVRNNTNVKRVSSSTQTELSVLKPVSGNNNNNNFGSSGVGQGQQRMKRSVLQQQYQGSIGKVKPGVGAVPTSQVATETATMPQISPVESSSGYSSPRGTESKSPTPEPTLGGVQQEQHPEPMAPGKSTPAPVNVTVIQIDPNPTVASSNGKNNLKEFQPRVTDVTYATPRKRSERGTPTGHNESTSTTPDQSFQVSIQSKPVSRSVSFHHMSQAGRKAVYGNEWLNASSLLGSHLPPLGVMSIPRPALRSNSHQRYSSPSGSSRRSSSNNVSANNGGGVTQQQHPSGSSLSRSTSMYLAMSEIQRKLDLLQVLDARHHIAVPSGDVVPVHRESRYIDNNQRNYDDYYSASPSHHTVERESSRRTRSRSNSSSSRQQQQLPPQPPPPPPPPPPPLPAVDLNDSLDSAKTLAYLSELEMLARHWRTQLLYKVELKSPNKRMMGTVLENDSFQC